MNYIHLEFENYPPRRFIREGIQKHWIYFFESLYISFHLFLLNIIYSRLLLS